MASGRRHLRTEVREGVVSYICSEDIPDETSTGGSASDFAAVAIAVALGAAGCLADLNSRVRFTVLLLATAAIVVALLRRGQVVEEEVIGVSGLGLELRRRFRSGRTSSDFIDAGLVEDIVIAEAVSFFDVFYYMAVILRGDGKQTKLPFRTMIPHMPELVEVLHGLRGLILHAQAASTSGSAAEQHRTIFEVGDWCEGRAADGEWWPVHVVAKHPDGTYAVDAQDGFGSRWPVAFPANLRPAS